MMLFASYMSRFITFSFDVFVAYGLFIVRLLETFVLVKCRPLCRRLQTVSEVIQDSFLVFSHENVICQPLSPRRVDVLSCRHVA